jgi:hypothetical protein
MKKNKSKHARQTKVFCQETLFYIPSNTRAVLFKNSKKLYLG